MNDVSSLRRVQRIRHETQRRDVEVTRVEPLGPGFVAVTFAGEALADFSSLGFDDHVKFIFPDVSGELVRRDYTPRRFDRDKRELTIEFVLHGEGEACRWARRATPGSPATIGGPKNSMVIPADYSWHLLVGDATALPAISRRLEELPPGTKAFVIVQADDESERRSFASAAELDVQWLSPEDDLAARVAALELPASDGFAWGAGEAAAMARLREVLVVDKQHPREAMRVASYWRKGASSLHETLESGLVRADG